MVVPFFLTASNFVRSQDPIWIRTGEELFVDLHHPQRQYLFAGQIHSGNILEFGRLHETTVEDGLGVHYDRENSDIHTMTSVVGLIVFRNGKRQEWTATCRSSVDNKFIQEDCDVPFMRHVGHIYKDFDPTRRQLSTLLFDGPQVKFFPGMDMIRNPCNFDPTSFF